MVLVSLSSWLLSMIAEIAQALHTAREAIGEVRAREATDEVLVLLLRSKFLLRCISFCGCCACVAAFRRRKYFAALLTGMLSLLLLSPVIFAYLLKFALTAGGTAIFCVLSVVSISDMDPQKSLNLLARRLLCGHLVASVVLVCIAFPSCCPWRYGVRAR
mmetsp:Transcript_177728/g.569804  ORF Transcript_177728/g.569804 Transcript_177728/m.569804 type:complete len:160 (+) Transcript_177728:580-1059(+)